MERLMKTFYEIKVTLLSDTLTASGEGFGAVIDTDIVFDSLGIPFIPAKRIKGCLRHSSNEVAKMLKMANSKIQIDVETTFGKKGAIDSAPVYFHNLTVLHYQKNYDWLNYFSQHQEYKMLVTPEMILETFTTLRQQTAIGDKGVAKPHSLRTLRVLRKGQQFISEITLYEESNAIINTLYYACKNLRFIGTNRNRGFGRVECVLLKKGQEIQISRKKG